ncbi:MAG: hypothetical protein DRJ42_19910 [Deltaproteobacteria bacterium]|nr:MAG: hypothetical protein DRJ42_19910 [Deltaproteobacteria bacterium]
MLASIDPELSKMTRKYGFTAVWAEAGAGAAKAAATNAIETAIQSKLRIGASSLRYRTLL